jgi:hypothetical protein
VLFTPSLFSRSLFVCLQLKDSGIDTSAWKNTKEIAKNELKKEALLKANEQSKKDSKITFHPNQPDNTSSRQGITSTTTTGRKNNALTTSTAATSTSSSSSSWWVKVLLVLGMAILIKGIDTYLATPIDVERVLSPGTVLHKCGIVGAIPGLQNMVSYVYPSIKECENASLVVEENKVIGYDADGNITWIISGTYHKTDQHCDVQDEIGCKRGLHFLEDKHLILSGTKITWVEVYQRGLSLTPWPFAEKPQIRIWKKK